jgi:hypothetical protein
MFHPVSKPFKQQQVDGAALFLKIRLAEIDLDCAGFPDKFEHGKVLARHIRA